MSKPRLLVIMSPRNPRTPKSVQASPVAANPVPPLPVAANPNAALIGKVGTAVTAIAQVATDLSSIPVVTNAQKQRSIKLRKGGGPVVRTLGRLAREHGLDSSVLPAEDMVSHVEMAQALEPLEAALAALLAKVSGARFLANSKAWATALKLYAVLQRSAADDPLIATGIAPLESFFAYRSPAVLLKTPTKRQANAKAKTAAAALLTSRAHPRAGSAQAEAQPPAPATLVVKEAPDAIATPAAVSKPA